MEFQGNDKAISIKLQTLWTDFDNLLMKENEGIKDYFSRVSEIVNQIQSCGDTIQEKKVVEKILRSLTQKFEHVVPAIEESKDLSKLSMYELMGSLETHEKRMSRFSSQSLEQAFQSTVNVSEKKFFNPKQDQRGGSSQRRGLYGRGRGNQNSGRGRGRGRRAIFQQKSGNSNSHCYVCKKPGHESKDCRWKCTKCKVPNHSQRDCWYQNKDKKETSEANFTQEDAAEQLFYSCMNVEHNSQNVWYLDSGCSNHMTGNREIFVELDGNYSSQAKLGDGKSKNVEGKGIVSILTKGGKEKFIHDVLYVPCLTQNLLSVGQMIQKGYKLVFDGEECLIFDKKNSTTVAKVDMTSNRVFPLGASLSDQVVLKSESVDESYIWHLRYGHLNDKGLFLLKQKNMIYSSVFMNNMMSLLTFLALVYIRNLPWDVSAEVLVVLIICTMMVCQTP
ncbi:hypothetical protein F0562_013851 [Nyssa sinensis]|uniref:CCHC-type domain-containing protein n=1 Tax=Nyssa sinensis TaxID=561372 RepID=A0A5J4ZPD0_9ASTE|nr:hypothetical protein F0562_013851 [Nyssa sinensis]